MCYPDHIGENNRRQCLRYTNDSNGRWIKEHDKGVR